MSKLEEGFFTDFMTRYVHVSPQGRPSGAHAYSSFFSIHRRNEIFIKRSQDWPAIGIFESELKQMETLVLIIHNFGPGDCDGIHKESVSRNLKELLPNSHCVVDIDARKWIPPIREFIKSFVASSYINDPTAR
jgi:hypothetical protein